jgi:hypothetical protein
MQRRRRRTHQDAVSKSKAVAALIVKVINESMTLPSVQNCTCMKGLAIFSNRPEEQSTPQIYAAGLHTRDVRTERDCAQKVKISGRLPS